MSILLRLVLALLGPTAAVVASVPVASLDRSGFPAVAVGRGVSVAAVGQDATSTPEGYAHPEWLAEAGWLRAHLGDPGLKVVALTPVDAFGRGHVPGAVSIDWPELEVTDTADASLARWRGTVEGALTRLGISRVDTVVIYDDGTLFAARLWWVLDYLGHGDKRILNGGLAAWRAAGGAIETGGTRVGGSPSNPYRGSPDPGVLAQVPEVEAALGDPAVALVDARSREEYAAGHVPGAVNVGYTANAASGEPAYWKPAAELRALYGAAGVAPDRRVVPYCTTGVRSAVTAFTLGLLGYDVALFTGSWAEWTQGGSDRPVETGVP